MTRNRSVDGVVADAKRFSGCLCKVLEDLEERCGQPRRLTAAVRAEVRLVYDGREVLVALVGDERHGVECTILSIDSQGNVLRLSDGDGNGSRKELACPSIPRRRGLEGCYSRLAGLLQRWRKWNARNLGSG